MIDSTTGLYSALQYECDRVLRSSMSSTEEKEEEGTTTVCVFACILSIHLIF